MKMKQQTPLYEAVGMWAIVHMVRRAAMRGFHNRHALTEAMRMKELKVDTTERNEFWYRCVWACLQMMLECERASKRATERSFSRSE